MIFCLIRSLLGSGLRIAIVHARWNTQIIEALVAGAKRSLLSAGVLEENIAVQSVPGSYELPYAVQRLATLMFLSDNHRNIKQDPKSELPNWIYL